MYRFIDSGMKRYRVQRFLSPSSWLLLLARFLILAYAGTAAANSDVLSIGQILERADNYRLSADSVQVTTRVRLYKTTEQLSLDQAEKERLYKVLIKPGRRSLVLFKSPSEIGQKVLMLDDRYWLLMPKSRRPLRITPMQKLLGEASTGDVSSLTWSEDYRGTVTGEQRITRLILLDRIAREKRTVIDYLDMSAVAIPDKVYNPAYLIRNPKL